MYRFLLTPRWWGINVFAVLAIPVCIFMGSWQLSRFEDRVDTHQQQKERTSEARTSTARPLAELLPVDQETSGRLAAAKGRYDTEHQLIVPDRELNKKRGFYVLTLLRTEGGKALPVVRGWLPGDANSRADTAKVPAPPSGEVTVVGALQAPENQGTDGVHARGGLPPGQLGIISNASLVNMVSYDFHPAWITVTDAQQPMRAVPPAAAEGTGLDLKAFQNLGYTAEWFVFAGFVVFMWFRLFRREVEAAKDAALGLGGPGEHGEPGGGTGGGLGGPGGAGESGASAVPPQAEGGAEAVSRS